MATLQNIINKLPRVLSRRYSETFWVNAANKVLLDIEQKQELPRVIEEYGLVLKDRITNYPIPSYVRKILGVYKAGQPNLNQKYDLPWKERGNILEIQSGYKFDETPIVKSAITKVDSTKTLLISNEFIDNSEHALVTALDGKNLGYTSVIQRYDHNQVVLRSDQQPLLVGNWDSNTAYIANSIVNFNAKYYQTLNAIPHDVVSNPDVDTKWDLLPLNPVGSWDASVSFYSPNDAVEHLGLYYYTILAPLAGEEPGVSVKWILEPDHKGNWSSSTAYNVLDIVNFGTLGVDLKWYKSNVAVNALNKSPIIDTSWSEVTNSYAYLKRPLPSDVLVGETFSVHTAYLLVEYIKGFDRTNDLVCNIVADDDVQRVLEEGIRYYGEIQTDEESQFALRWQFQYNKAIKSYCNFKNRGKFKPKAKMMKANLGAVRGEQSRLFGNLSGIYGDKDAQG